MFRLTNRNCRPSKGDGPSPPAKRVFIPQTGADFSGAETAARGWGHAWTLPAGSNTSWQFLSVVPTPISDSSSLPKRFRVVRVEGVIYDITPPSSSSDITGTLTGTSGFSGGSLTAIPLPISGCPSGGGGGLYTGLYGQNLSIPSPWPTSGTQFNFFVATGITFTGTIANPASVPALAGGGDYTIPQQIGNLSLPAYSKYRASISLGMPLGSPPVQLALGIYVSKYLGTSREKWEIRDPLVDVYSQMDDWLMLATDTYYLPVVRGGYVNRQLDVSLDCDVVIGSGEALHLTVSSATPTVATLTLLPFLRTIIEEIV